MNYAPHKAFIAPALPTAEPGRLLFGVLAIELLYEVTLEVLSAGAELISPAFAESFVYGDTPLGLLLNLASFIFFALWVLLIAGRQHGRGLASLIGPLPPAVRQFAITLPAVALVFLAIEVARPAFATPMVSETRDVGQWLMLLPLGLAALLIQTGSEEIMYRGYVQQQLAARFTSPLVWMVLPNLLFASAHWTSGADLMENGQYLIWTFLFGLFASDLTARSGTLGPAIAFHLANNAYAFLFFGEAGGPNSGLALWLFPYEGEPPVPDMLITSPLLTELVILVMMWLAARVALRR